MQRGGRGYLEGCSPRLVRGGREEEREEERGEEKGAG